MAFIAKKTRKRASKVNSIMVAFRYIWNSLLSGWEVWDSVTESLSGVKDAADQVKEIAEDEKQKLSKDYQDAERYVSEGISEAKDVWEELKEAF